MCVTNKKEPCQEKNEAERGTHNILYFSHARDHVQGRILYLYLYLWDPSLTPRCLSFPVCCCKQLQSFVYPFAVVSFWYFMLSTGLGLFLCFFFCCCPFSLPLAYTPAATTAPASAPAPAPAAATCPDFLDESFRPVAWTASVVKLALMCSRL